MIDNNGRPGGGGRVAATFRIGEANDMTVGGSVMYGTWDPDNRFYYLIGGGDLSARIGRTQVRLEYLVRRQTFAPPPGVAVQADRAAVGRGVVREARRVSGDRTIDVRDRHAASARRRSLPRRERARDQPARAARLPCFVTPPPERWRSRRDSA
jgi:hypothetical protein